MITIVGFIMMLCIILLLGIKKAPMIPTFIIIPLLVLLLLGYKPAEIGGILQSSVYSAMTNTGLLLMFSIMFFAVLTEAGVFDRLVNMLIRATKGNVYAVLLSTVGIATIGQLDGSLVTTFLIAIPPLVPLYDKLRLDKRYLLLLTSLVLIGFEPEWSGALQMAVALGGVSAHDVSIRMIPTMIITYAAAFGCCILFGRWHIRKNGHLTVSVDDLVSDGADAPASARPKLFWVNIGLIACCIVCLMTLKMPTYITFMAFLAIAMMLNYPKTADQTRIIKKYASAYLNPIMLIVCINVLVGVMQGTGISVSFAETVISWIPASIAKYTFIIFAALVVPICQLVPYQVFQAMIPFIVAIETSCGVNPTIVMAAYGCNMLFGTVCSRYVAQTHLGIGLLCSGDEDPETMMTRYVRFAFPTCTVLNIIVLLGSALIGVYR